MAASMAADHDPSGLAGITELRLRPNGLSGDRVDRKCVLAEHRIQARRQIGTGDQLQNIVGAVTERHLVSSTPAPYRSANLT
jgi:hypothetical protein